MCWRGHSLDRLNKHGACKECHRRRALRYRNGLPTIKQPHYRLRADVFWKWQRKHRKPVHIIADLSGVSLDTMRCWLYGLRHNGGQTATEETKAKALADLFQIKIDELFDRLS
jgi:hypothetical protein